MVPAINAFRGQSPTPPISRQVKWDMRTSKDGWGEFVLRRMLSDAKDRSLILQHLISRRLGERLP